MKKYLFHTKNKFTFAKDIAQKVDNNLKENIVKFKNV
jgi:hypothetical protein